MQAVSLLFQSLNAHSSCFSLAEIDLVNLSKKKYFIFNNSLDCLPVVKVVTARIFYSFYLLSNILLISNLITTKYISFSRRVILLNGLRNIR